VNRQYQVVQYRWVLYYNPMVRYTLTIIRMNVLYDDGHIMIHVSETDDVQYVRDICYWCDMYTLIIIRMMAFMW
jgi:hypothetical protein